MLCRLSSCERCAPWVARNAGSVTVVQPVSSLVMRAARKRQVPGRITFAAPEAIANPPRRPRCLTPMKSFSRPPSYLGPNGDDDMRASLIQAVGSPVAKSGDSVRLGVGSTQGQAQPRTVVGRAQGSVDRSERSVEHDLVDAGVVVEVLDVA